MKIPSFLSCLIGAQPSAAMLRRNLLGTAATSTVVVAGLAATMEAVYATTAVEVPTVFPWVMARTSITNPNLGLDLGLGFVSMLLPPVGVTALGLWITARIARALETGLTKWVARAAEAAVVLALLAPPQAKADMPVVDPIAIAASAMQSVQQISQLVTMYREMQAQYGGIMQTVGALSHPLNTLSMAPGLLQQAMRLPGSAASMIPGLSFGSQATGAASQFLNQNRFAQVPSVSGATASDNFSAQEMQRREQVTANLQAEVQDGINRAEQRITSLTQLQTSIDGQPDVQAVTAAHAAIQAEQTYLSNEGNNVARLQLLASLAGRVDAQRTEQQARSSAQDWSQRAAQAAGIPAPTVTPSNDISDVASN